MGDELVFKSASVVPMLSSSGKMLQDPEDREKSASAEKFRWDGRFVNDPRFSGSWKAVAQVAEATDFDPSSKNRVNRPPFASITLKKTDNRYGHGRDPDGSDQVPFSRWKPENLTARTTYLWRRVASCKKPGWK